MYSFEIDDLLKRRNFTITVSEYIEISDINKNSQIARITYNSFSNNFTIFTDDNWNWTFTIQNK